MSHRSLFHADPPNLVLPQFKNVIMEEGSVGVGNIFKVLRVDAVKRFSYLDNPNVSSWGIRARVKFDF